MQASGATTADDLSNRPCSAGEPELHSTPVIVVKATARAGGLPPSVAVEAEGGLGRSPWRMEEGRGSGLTEMGENLADGLGVVEGRDSSATALFSASTRAVTRGLRGALGAKTPWYR